MKDKLKSLWQFFFGDSARAFGSMSLILLVLLASLRPKITSANGVVFKSNTYISFVAVLTQLRWNVISKAASSRFGFLSSRSPIAARPAILD